MVRSFLNGRFENTAFCILAPDGKERLSGTGRSPAMGFGAGGSRGDADQQNPAVLSAMERISKKYKTKEDLNEPVVQDFHTFKQALNVASADQRLLLFIAAGEVPAERLRASLRPVLGDPEIIGRFHSDFGNRETDAKWTESVEGSKRKGGLYIIAADQFGQKGKVLETLPLDAKTDEIKATLLKANQTYAKTEERKVYRDHVSKGRKEGVQFDAGMPYGEDRDGDGVIDHRGGGGRKGGRGRGGNRPD